MNSSNARMKSREVSENSWSDGRSPQNRRAGDESEVPLSSVHPSFSQDRSLAQRLRSRLPEAIGWDGDMDTLRLHRPTLAPLPSQIPRRHRIRIPPEANLPIPCSFLGLRVLDPVSYRLLPAVLPIPPGHSCGHLL